ncbi:hypothetical protein ACPXCO_37455 [Streptomyces cyaneofuscatus]
MDIGSSSVHGNNNGTVQALTHVVFVLKSETEMVEGDDGQQAAKRRRGP